MSKVRKLASFSKIKRGEDNKRPATTAQYVDTVFVGDRSGSMSSMGDSPQEGIKGFMRDQKELSENGGNVYLQVVTFDDQAEVVYSGNAGKVTKTDLKRCGEEMTPRGCTRLYDTAIEAINAQAGRIRKLKASWPKSIRDLNPKISVIFALLTDGNDNSSKKTSKDLQNAVTKHRKEFDANCIFMAANQDAICTGKDYGFCPDLSMQMSPDKEYSSNAFKNVSGLCKRTVTLDAPPAFTNLERYTSCDPYDQYSQNAELNMDSDEDLDNDDCFPSVPLQTTLDSGVKLSRS